MTQEDKELLLKDLCARLPYKVKGQAVSDGEIYRISSIISVSPSGEALLMLDDNNIDFVTLEQTKPYLRPMSSMTEEERKELNGIGFIVPLYDGCFGVDMRAYCKNGQPHYRRFSDFSTIEDWLNEHHFDYRGLIEKGLALEAPEGMYDFKTE